MGMMGVEEDNCRQAAAAKLGHFSGMGKKTGQSLPHR
jgi:hypothetical protein